MLKQRVILEVKGASEKMYRFECETDSPLGEIYDVLHQMSEKVVQNIQSKQEVRKPKKEEVSEEPKKEECCAEGQPCEQVTQEPCAQENQPTPADQS